MRMTFYTDTVIVENKALEVNVNTINADRWVVPLTVNGTKMHMKLDTGAMANLITLKDFNVLDHKPVRENKKVRLRAYNGQMIETQGVCRLQVQNKHIMRNLPFVIVPKGKDSLLGDQACEEMGLVKRVLNIVKTERKEQSPQLKNVTTSQADYWEAQYPNIFDGIGVLPFTYSIKLKDNARPVVHVLRRIPVPLRKDHRKELDRMVSLNVIQPTKGATEWVNSMVCVRKPNGALRICMESKRP